MGGLDGLVGLSDVVPFVERFPVVLGDGLLEGVRVLNLDEGVDSYRHLDDEDCQQNDGVLKIKGH